MNKKHDPDKVEVFIQGNKVIGYDQDLKVKLENQTNKNTLETLEAVAAAERGEVEAFDTVEELMTDLNEEIDVFYRLKKEQNK